MTAVLFECLRSAFPLPLQPGGCAGQLGVGGGGEKRQTTFGALLVQSRSSATDRVALHSFIYLKQDFVIFFSGNCCWLLQVHVKLT